MNINTSLVDLGNYLENQKLVEINGTDSQIANLSFEEIKGCCSLSNQNLINRFVYRIFAFFKTKQWMNDKNIGINLFYTFLWINSTIAKDMQSQDDSRKEFLLNQLGLMDKIFDQVVLAGFKGGHKFTSIPQQNKANPTISAMFPIQISSNVGATAANFLADRVKRLKNICEQDNPYEFAINQFTLQQLIPIAHIPQINTTVEAGCWRQTVIHPLLLNSIEHRATCTSTYGSGVDKEDLHLSEDKRDSWWNDKSTLEKMEEIYNSRIVLEKVDETYSIKKQVLPPYKIQVKLSFS